MIIRNLLNGIFSTHFSFILFSQLSSFFNLTSFDRGLALNPGAKDLKENREQAILHQDMARDSVRMATTNSSLRE